MWVRRMSWLSNMRTDECRVVEGWARCSSPELPIAVSQVKFWQNAHVWCAQKYIRRYQKTRRGVVGSNFGGGYAVRANGKAHIEAVSDKFITNEMRKTFCPVSEVYSKQMGQWHWHRLFDYYNYGRQQSRARHGETAGNGWANCAFLRMKRVERCRWGVDEFSIEAEPGTKMVKARKKKRKQKRVRESGENDLVFSTIPKEMAVVRWRRAARAESNVERREKNKERNVRKECEALVEDERCLRESDWSLAVCGMRERL